MQITGEVQEDSLYDKWKAIYDIYCQVGGYPKVVQTYLESKDIQKAQGELVKIIDMFINESIRYFTDILERMVLL